MLLKLYKFSKINDNFIDSMTNNYLYFSIPEKMNDPLDCQYNILTCIGYSLRQLKLHNIYNSYDYFYQQLINNNDIDGINKLTKNAGISCFSLCDTSLPKPIHNYLMWSHYGDEHKGVCIEYNIDRDILPKLLDGYLYGDAPVEYGDNLLIKWLIENSKYYSEADYEKFCLHVVQQRFLIKNECWKYENEYRIIIKKGDEKINIPRNYINKIFFGCKTDNSDITKIKNIFPKDNIEFIYMRVDETGCNIKPYRVMPSKSINGISHFEEYS